MTDMKRRVVSTGDAGSGAEILVDCLSLLLEAVELLPGRVVVPTHHISSDQQETPAERRSGWNQ